MTSTCVGEGERQNKLLSIIFLQHENRKLVYTPKNPEHVHDQHSTRARGKDITGRKKQRHDGAEKNTSTT